MGSPIQKSPDQRMFSSSPMLIAAYRVFHRLSAPRHSPAALDILFLKNFTIPFPFPYSIIKEQRLRSFRNPRPGHAWMIATSCVSTTNHGLSCQDLCGGGRRNRTVDPLRAKQMLSQLSYTPDKWWAWKDLNFRPHAYQACALAT